MKDAPIVWADDAQTGAARHISEVEIGLACHCVCTGYHATMEAVNPKNPNPKHRPYFRHDKAPILEDCARQAILKATIKTLMESTEIELPELLIKGKAVAQDGMPFEAEVIEQPQRVKIQNIEQVARVRWNGMLDFIFEFNFSSIPEKAISISTRNSL